MATGELADFEELKYSQESSTGELYSGRLDAEGLELSLILEGSLRKSGEVPRSLPQPVSVGRGVPGFSPVGFPEGDKKSGRLTLDDKSSSLYEWEFCCARSVGGES